MTVDIEAGGIGTGVATSAEIPSIADVRLMVNFPLDTIKLSESAADVNARLPG
jgi:hypothetical protein